MTLYLFLQIPSVHDKKEKSFSQRTFDMSKQLTVIQIYNKLFLLVSTHFDRSLCISMHVCFLYIYMRRRIYDGCNSVSSNTIDLSLDVGMAFQFCQGLTLSCVNVGHLLQQLLHHYFVEPSYDVLVHQLRYILFFTHQFNLDVTIIHYTLN